MLTSIYVTIFLGHKNSKRNTLKTQKQSRDKKQARYVEQDDRERVQKISGKSLG